MTCSEGLFPDGQAPPEQRLGLGILALEMIKERQIVQGFTDVRMCGAQGLLADSESLLEQGLGLGIVTLGAIEDPQTVQGSSRLGIVRANGFLRNLQCLFRGLGPLGIPSVLIKGLGPRIQLAPQFLLGKRGHRSQYGQRQH